MNESSEDWKPVPGFEGEYLASTEGRIWSVHRGQFLTAYANPKPRGDSYLRVDLYRGGEVEKLYVHNVILRTFEGRRPGDPEEVHGHHIDGDRFNNATSNLEWKEVEEHHQEHNERDEWEPEPAPF